MSLTPLASMYGALLAIATAVMIVVLTGLSDDEFWWISALLVGVVIIGIFIGAVQVATAGTAFRFYRETDAGALVGFYANKNHMALAIACSIAIAHFMSRSAKDWIPRARVLFFGYWIFAALTLPLTNSRAGLVLGGLISLAIGWAIASSGMTLKKRATVLVLLASGPLLFVFLPLPTELTSRFGDVAADVRWPILQQSMVLWKDYWLFGSGLGSFADVHMTYEMPSWLFETYVNNVHNDYVQLGIETGLLGLVSVILFATGVMKAVTRALGSDSEMANNLALMGFVVLLAFALHSIVDYPLRRPAAVLIFALATAAVFRSALVRDEQRLSTVPGAGTPG